MEICFLKFSVTGGHPGEVKIEVNVNGKPFPFMFSDDLTKVAFSVRRDDGRRIYIRSPIFDD